MEKLAAIFVFSLLLIFFFWRFILDGILYLFIPKKYSLEGKIIDLWEEPSSVVFVPILVSKVESGEALIQMKKVTLYSYFVSMSIIGEEDVTTLQVNSETFEKLSNFKSFGNDFLTITCKKYAWCKVIDIVNIN